MLIAESPAHGTLIVGSDGTVDYTHDGSETTSDSFTYVIRDASGSLSARATVTIEIVPVNDVPLLMLPATQSTSEDTPVSISGISVADVDSSQLQVTLQVSGGQLTLATTENLTVSGDGTSSIVASGTSDDLNAAIGTVLYTPSGDASGSVNLTATVDDGEFVAGDDLVVTVTPVNDAPVLSGLPDVTFDEDDSDSSVDLDEYYSDVETLAQDATFVVSSSPPGVIATIDPATHLLTLSGDSDFNGDGTVTIEVTDGGDGSSKALTTTDTLGVFVTPVNDMPSLSGIPDVTLAEDGSDTSIDLDDYFSDVETLASDATFVVATSFPGITATINPGTHVLTLIGTADFSGSGELTIQVTDAGDGPSPALSATDMLIVTVTPVNDTPSLSGIPDVEFAEDGSDSSIDLDDFYGDVETPAAGATFVVAYASPGIIATIDDVSHLLTLSGEADFNGAGVVTIQVSDGGDGASAARSVIDGLNVTVTPVNDAPSFSGIPNVTFDEDGSDSSIDLDDYYSDVETPSGDAVFVVTTTFPGITATIDPDTHILTLVGDPDFNGGGDVTVEVTDTGDGTATALTAVDTLSVTVTPVNDAPSLSGIPDVTFDEDGSDNSIDLDAYFSDVETLAGDATFVVASSFPGITATIDPATHVLTLAGDPDFNGSGEVIIEAIDRVDGASVALTATDALSVTVTPVNDAPIAADDSASVDEGATVAIDLAANDSDAENTLDLNSLVIGAAPAHGSLVVNADGTVGYTHDGSETTGDSFTYTIRDIDGAVSNEATVTITVTPVNDAPVAADDSTSADEGATVTIDLAANDTDAENSLDLNSIVISTDSAHGAVVINADGTVDYTHDGSETTDDSFTYTIRDLDGAVSNEATVTITVTPINDAPVAGADSTTVDEGDTVTIDLAANDSDAENTLDLNSIVIGAAPAHGSLVVNADGTIGYTHDGSETISDSFTYTIRDLDGAVSNEATVTITVTPVNDAPIAGDDTATVDEDRTVTIAILDNDSDVEGDALSVSAVSVPANGTTIINVDGTITYTPDANFNGTDEFTYTVEDGNGGSAIGTVTVTVNSRPDVDLSGIVFEDGNNDGLINEADAGIAGISVQLFDESDLQVPLATVLTGIDGTYLFDLDLEEGSYRIVAEQPAGLLDGTETAGVLGGNVINTVDSNTISTIVVPADVDDLVVDGYHFANIRPSRIQGLVWRDDNDDGEVDFGEQAIEGVTIRLSGTDDRGAVVDQVMQTDGQGIFEFIGLRPSDADGYTLTETQPLEYLDGIDTLGTVDGVTSGSTAVDDVFSQIGMTQPASDAVNYNFGERLVAGGAVETGQTAGIGFWQNKHGQALIRSLGGGSDSTDLATWLAVTFPNMYGVSAGPNDLTGLTNDQVASFYKTLFKRNGKTAAGAGPPKVDAQAMAVALAVYVTNENLAGTTAEAYGFTVSEFGAGISTINIGSNGDAFGVEDDTDISLLTLLHETDARTSSGLLFDLDGDGQIDNAEKALRTMGNDVFSRINEQGQI